VVHDVSFRAAAATCSPGWGVFQPSIHEQRCARHDLSVEAAAVKQFAGAAQLCRAICYLNNSMKATFIGIGAQKCASTWLYQALGLHPAIGTSHIKELDFFSYAYGFGFEWYESFNQGFAGKKVVGEVSPSYFHDLEAPARAYAYNPDFKIIVSLRDPIERAYSNHLHLIRVGHIKGADRTFEYGIRNNPMYLHQSRYAMHLERWLSIFPRDALHVVLQEDVNVDPVGEMRRMFDFLGVDREAGSLPTKARANRSAIPKSAWVDRSLKSIGRGARHIGLGDAVTRFKSIRAVQQMRARNEMDLRKLVSPPQAETLEELKAYFAGDVSFVRTLQARPSLPWKHFLE
jgi:hypothetical protein